MSNAPTPASASAPAPASPREALAMLESAMCYLAAADPTAMAADTQAQALRGLERLDAVEVAARTAILGAFTGAKNYRDDAAYSPRSWLIHQTKITRGAATAHVAWVRRAAAHPRVLAALAARDISESYARTICSWTDKLPARSRQDGDEALLAAAVTGADLAALAGFAADLYEQSLPDTAQDDDTDEDFDDRSVTVATTFGGAGVIHGNLTPECAAVVTTVLEALSAPRGAEDTRTHDQRFHDGLQDALHRLVAAGLVPERAGQPTRALVHVTLAELCAMDAGSALQGEWITVVRGRWAAARAQASVTGGDGSAWLDGPAARAVTCDAAMVPVVTGDVDTARWTTWSGCPLSCPAMAGAAITPAIKTNVKNRLKTKPRPRSKIRGRARIRSRAKVKAARSKTRLIGWTRAMTSMSAWGLATPAARTMTSMPARGLATPAARAIGR